MIFEGTGKYFWLIFLIFFIVFITVKICQTYIFKTMKIKSWKAFIPFYNRLLLIEKLDLKKSIFYKTLIPFANLYYYYIIISKLLEAYNMDPKDAIYYILIPMYKFPELVFRKPEFTLHMYDNTEAFIRDEKSLFEKEQNVEEIKPQNIVVNPNSYDQMGNQTINQNYQNESVFSNSSLEPDERKETTIEAKQEVKQEVKPINLVDNRPRVCPKCGTKLEPTAKICFFCGTQIS